jgi:hypothetical protein
MAKFEPFGLQARLIEAKALTDLDMGPEQEWALAGWFGRVRYVMRVYSGHWLDYDPVALVILVVGIGAVALLALSI